MFISLFVLFYALSFTGIYQTIHASLLQLYGQMSPTHSSAVTVIKATDLSKQANDIKAALDNYSPRVVVFLSESPLSDTPSPDYELVQPNHNGDYCLPTLQVRPFRLISPATATCSNLWHQLFFPQTVELYPVYLDFSLPLNALPQFRASRLLSGDLFNEQIDNRIILVGQESRFTEAFDFQYSFMQTQAMVADNYARNKLLFPIATVSSLVLQGILLIILLVWFQRNNVISNLFKALLLSLFFVLFGLISTVYFKRLLPMGELVSLPWFALLWSFVIAKYSEEQALIKLLTNTRERMLGRSLPHNFLDQSDPWHPLLKLTSQQLSLTKSVFLSRIDGDHRLSEVLAMNCALEDIQEMRRDFERSPYSDAIKEMGAIVSTRPFFNHTLSTDTTYLAPLIYAGDVRGFWAMTVEAEADFNETAFLKNVNAFARQIGELLFHYKVYQSDKKSSQSALVKALTFNFRESISQKITTSLNQMEHKLLVQEAILNHLSVAVVKFNLFGQIVQINSAMETLAKRHAFPVFELSALDLLIACTGFTEQQAKGKLRFLTLHQGKLSLPIQLNSHPYIMLVRTIKQQKNVSSTTPFAISGIIFELLDCRLYTDSIEQPAPSLRDNQQVDP